MMAASSRGVVTGVTVALLALAAYAGDAAVAVLLAVVGSVFAFGWPRLVSVPSKRGTWVVIGLAGIAAIVSVWFTQDILWLATVVAGGVIGAFVHQMARRDGRPRLVETVCATVTGVVVVVSSVGWLMTSLVRGGLELTLVSAAVLLVAAMITTIPAPGVVVASGAAAIAGAVGMLVGSLLGEVGLVPGLLIGVGGGGLMALSHLLFNQFPASGNRRAALAAALMPLATLGTPVYLVAQVVG